jgi:DNA-binding response OmpR family regulator
MSRFEVLIVEDEQEMAAVLAEGFRCDHYSVTVAGDGETALRLASQHEFAAIVLDVMLPAMDGFAVVTELRKNGSRTPVLILTARDAITDIVFGLDCGVEDYVTKPFSFLELSARVRALIRRNQPHQTSWRIGDLYLEAASHKVSRDERPIRLTKTEFRILEILLRNVNHVVAREELLRAVWGSIARDYDNNLDVTISALRAKVDKGSDIHLIQTVRGFGYRIVDPSNE